MKAKIGFIALLAAQLMAPARFYGDDATAGEPALTDAGTVVSVTDGDASSQGERPLAVDAGRVLPVGDQPAAANTPGEQLDRLVVAPSIPSATEPGIDRVYPQKRKTDFTDLLEGRLEVGLQLSYFQFVNARGTSTTADGLPAGYTPAITTYDLDEVQDYGPTLYLRYKFNPNFAIKIGWEHVEGRTKTRYRYSTTPSEQSNGNAVLSGLSVTAQGLLPLDHLDGFWSRVTPHAGLGIAFFSGSFDHDPDWHDNGRRIMSVEDENGIMLTGGASVEMTRDWALDLSATYLQVEPQARYRLWVDQGYRAEWKFPMDSWLLQCAVKYTF